MRPHYAGPTMGFQVYVAKLRKAVCRARTARPVAPDLVPLLPRIWTHKAMETANEVCQNCCQNRASPVISRSNTP